MSTNTSVRTVAKKVGNAGIRLADGRSYDYGRLEIFVNGKWGTVCDYWFGYNDAQVACRQLGFMKAKYSYTHGGGSGPIWLDRLQCGGSENNLLSCKHRGLGVNGCNHGEDVGVVCEFLGSYLENTFFWKGVKFKNSKIPSTLQYVDISHAFKAIFGDEYLPEIDHVRVTNSALGVTSINLKSPLVLTDIALRDNIFAGVQITGKSKTIEIRNTIVANTSKGDGFSYAGIEETVDFCSVIEENVSFPITFRAVGQARRNVECSKVFQSVGGNRLVIYVHSTPDSSQTFELFVYDGIAANGTLLVHVKSVAKKEQ
ncbi:protein bark beetle-like [Dendronephthya gigantea]|uniref:protein bark beetle-like n=1 Tax=Dendronephthya gigantea TaxID=151771 RepID=UPI00106A87E9|nr:protein bark beetle-like [Dendronephthya gigantea]